MKSYSAKKKYSHLPAHLQTVLDNHYAKHAAFGLDPDYAVDAMNNAKECCSDFSLVHGLVG